MSTPAKSSLVCNKSRDHKWPPKVSPSPYSHTHTRHLDFFAHEAPGTRTQRQYFGSLAVNRTVMYAGLARLGIVVGDVVVGGNQLPGAAQPHVWYLSLASEQETPDMQIQNGRLVNHCRWCRHTKRGGVVSPRFSIPNEDVCVLYGLADLFIRSRGYRSCHLGVVSIDWQKIWRRAYLPASWRLPSRTLKAASCALWHAYLQCGVVSI